MNPEIYQANTAKMTRYTPVGSNDLGRILSRNGSRTVRAISSQWNELSIESGSLMSTFTGGTFCISVLLVVKYSAAANT